MKIIDRYKAYSEFHKPEFRYRGEANDPFGLDSVE